METPEQEFASLRSSGSSSDEMVYVELTGDRFTSVQVARNLMDPDHPRALEKAVLAAVNEALSNHHVASADLIEKFKREHAPATPDELGRIETVLQEIRDRRAP